MMGLLIAGFAATGIVTLTLIRRDLPLLILIAIFVLTAEMGDGFTSFQGSIFFNQNFLHLASLKLIEVILYTYAGALILLNIPIRRKPAPSPLRRLYLLWVIWSVVLLFVQYESHGFIDPTLFRGIYFGWALLYVFTIVTDNRLAMKRVIVFTFVLIIVKVLWLMLMFAIGHGEHTTRGYSPIFWDDRLLGGFVWVFLVLLIALLQPRSERGNWPTAWVSLALVLIFVVIALSLRRSYLEQLLIGSLFLLFSKSLQISFRRVLPFALVVVFLLGVAFTTGLVIGNRLPLVQQLNKYVQILNFTSVEDFANRPENQVHLVNVQTYFTILSEYEGIRLFGRSAAPTENFQNFNREYMSSLGLAHNGPLRAIFDFGIGGLVVWSGFYLVAFRAIRRSKFIQLEPWEQALLLGSAVTVFSHLAITITFDPPFFTTFKGLFFFLFLVVTIEFYSRESQLLEMSTPETPPVHQFMGSNTSSVERARSTGYLR